MHYHLYSTGLVVTPSGRGAVPGRAWLLSELIVTGVPRDAGPLASFLFRTAATPSSAQGHPTRGRDRESGAVLAGLPHHVSARCRRFPGRCCSLVSWQGHTEPAFFSARPAPLEGCHLPCWSTDWAAGSEDAGAPRSGDRWQLGSLGSHGLDDRGSALTKPLWAPLSCQTTLPGPFRLLWLTVQPQMPLSSVQLLLLPGYGKKQTKAKGRVLMVWDSPWGEGNSASL